MKSIDVSGMSREELEQFAVDVSSKLEEQAQKIQYYEEQLRILQEKRFGRKSEDNLKGQVSMFNEPELMQQPEAKEPQMSDVHPPRNTKKQKQKGSRDAFLRPLAKETLQFTLSAEEAVCPVCGEPLCEMKKEIRKELVVVPATVKVREFVRYSYTCRHCEKKGTDSVIVRAPAPASLLRGSLLSPSLAAYLICRKYNNRDSLYKISEDFLLLGLKLSRQTLANWMVRLSEEYGLLLWKRMRRRMLCLQETAESFDHGGESDTLPENCPILYADETPVQVLHEPDRTALQKSYMWVFSSGGEAPPIRLYQYAQSRSREVAETFLNGYMGYVQSDGYAVYRGLEGTILNVGCMAHVRRKYRDAVKSQPKDTVSAENGAGKGLDYCRRLLKLDAQRKELAKEKQAAYKTETIRPLMEEFFAWAEGEKRQVPEKSALGKALTYTTNQKEQLMNYLRDGRLEMTNNEAERTVRPFVMGRKNWLFCNTPRGADASAVLYSLVETAKANRLNPAAYLEWILDEMKGGVLTDEFLDSLLPWSDQVPETCRIPEGQEREETEAVQ